MEFWVDVSSLEEKRNSFLAFLHLLLKLFPHHFSFFFKFEFMLVIWKMLKVDANDD